MTDQSDQLYEAEYQLDVARAEAERQRETAEFIRSLGPNDELVRPILNPEAWVARDKARAAAKHAPRTQCRHPLQAIKQMIDQDPARPRHNQPVNLFQCAACNSLLWLTDAWGNAVDDS